MTTLSRRSGSDSPDAAPIHLQFDDNTLLASLYGEHDRHLARIEQRLGVSLRSRGNRLAISGPQHASAAAKTALGALYDRLKHGQPVDLGEVEAAIRLATSLPGDGASEAAGDDVAFRTKKRNIVPRSANQLAYARALRDYELVFALGPAGTGKTYLAVAQAVTMLLSGQVDRIILSRPAVEAGERLGFLPGDLREKVDPYLRPLYDALHDMLPGDQVLKRLALGEIEVAPLAFMRGRTLANSFVILDEAQNTTPVQMKMFLTRLGEHSRMVVTGDPSQIDLPEGVDSGLRDALGALDGLQGAAFIHFTDVDIMRHPLVTRIVRAYQNQAQQRRKPGRPAP